MRRRTYPESGLQETVVSLLRYSARRGVMVVAVQNEGKRTPQAAAKLVKRGMRPGAGDLMLTIDQRTHWLELKDGSRPQSKDQRSFELECEWHGIPYRLARSFDQAKGILEEWGAFRQTERRAA